ncbi:hypothetical protein H5T52_03165 [Candidatus Bipolaricaulota bacterium]|nr:hypothetical protein [Candidatus Bipolaricaulota bacterium]
MNQSFETIRTIIVRSVKSLISTGKFTRWFKDQKPKDGDLVVINNSFIYRKPSNQKSSIKTIKNEQYLSFKVKGGRLSPETVLIATPNAFNSDFKLFRAESSNLPPSKSLSEALQREIEHLGHLVFVLIGKLVDIPASVPVNHKHVKELRFDPSIQNEPVVKEEEDGKVIIIVKNLNDPKGVWDGVMPTLQQKVGNNVSNLESVFTSAFERLQDEARLKLYLPEPTARKTKATFIARLRQSVAEQRRLYETALKKCAEGGSTGDTYLREVMRIAYNFADDALKILRLLVSIADLKAVLLWCTVKQHFDVAEALRSLSGTKSSGKALLEWYQKTIKDARNRAFHNLLAFDRTIEADLTNVQVNARRLILLPAHGHRGRTATFDYEDREMVEVLKELTRAPEVAVPLDFWKKNCIVMKSFEKLLKNTEDALWALNGARNR